jgi:hypothetical protein
MRERRYAFFEGYYASVAQKDAYSPSDFFVRAKKGNVLEYALFY